MVTGEKINQVRARNPVLRLRSCVTTNHTFGKGAGSGGGGWGGREGEGRGVGEGGGGRGKVGDTKPKLLTAVLLYGELRGQAKMIYCSGKRHRKRYRTDTSPALNVACSTSPSGSAWSLSLWSCK